MISIKLNFVNTKSDIELTMLVLAGMANGAVCSAQAYTAIFEVRGKLKFHGLLLIGEAGKKN